MPILDVDKAHTVMVIKRSMNPGFAGIDNELYYMDKTLMLFGDAKAFVDRDPQRTPRPRRGLSAHVLVRPAFRLIGMPGRSRPAVRPGARSVSPAAQNIQNVINRPPKH